MRAVSSYPLLRENMVCANSPFNGRGLVADGQLHKRQVQPSPQPGQIAHTTNADLKKKPHLTML